jgi:hypothetical protein
VNAQELRGHRDAEVDIRRAPAPLLEPSHERAADGAGRDCAPIDHRHEALDPAKLLRDLVGDPLHVLEVHGPVTAGRGADADEDDLRAGECLGELGRDREPGRRARRRDELVQPRLDDGAPPAVDLLHLRAVDIDADHVVPELGEARGRDRAHVPEADDDDVHLDSPSPLRALTGRSPLSSAPAASVGAGSAERTRARRGRGSAGSA